MRQRRVLFHKLADFVAISHRHEYVSQHQIRPQIGNLAYRGLAIANGNHVYALVFQGQTHHLLDVAVVVRNQNPGHRTSSEDTATAPHTTAQLYWSIRSNTRQRQPEACVSEGEYRISILICAPTSKKAGHGETQLK